MEDDLRVREPSHSHTSSISPAIRRALLVAGIEVPVRGPTLSLKLPETAPLRRCKAEEIRWGAWIAAGSVLHAVVHQPNLGETEPVKVGWVIHAIDFLPHIP